MNGPSTDKGLAQTCQSAQKIGFYSVEVNAKSGPNIFSLFVLCTYFEEEWELHISKFLSSLCTVCSWLKLLHGFIWDFSQAHEPALSQWRQKHNLVFTFQCFLSLSSTLNLVGAHTLPNYFCAWLNQTNFNCTYSILLVVSLFCLCIHRFF